MKWCIKPGVRSLEEASAGNEKSKACRFWGVFSGQKCPQLPGIYHVDEYFLKLRQEVHNLLCNVGIIVLAGKAGSANPIGKDWHICPGVGEG